MSGSLRIPQRAPAMEIGRDESCRFRRVLPASFHLRRRGVNADARSESLKIPLSTLPTLWSDHTLGLNCIIRCRG